MTETERAALASVAEKMKGEAEGLGEDSAIAVKLRRWAGDLRLYASLGERAPVRRTRTRAGRCAAD